MGVVARVLDWLSGVRRDPLGNPRDGKWRAFEAQLILAHPFCSRCGKTQREVEQSGGELLGHHVVPFHEDPSKELDPGNIEVVCEHTPMGCHLTDHLGSYKSHDKDARRHNAEYLALVEHRP